MTYHDFTISNLKNLVYFTYLTKKGVIIIKKLLIAVAGFLFLAVPIFATNKGNVQGSTGNKQGTASQAQQQLKTASPSPTGNQVQNQNQINTKNQGEETQLQVQNEEKENLEESQGEGLQTRSQTALQNMSGVAKQVQLLLQIRTFGGIGEQVRQIAQEQNQAQTQIQTQLEKIDSRKGIIKSLLGPDFGAIKNLKQQMEQNRLRIEQLTQLQSQLSNQGDITNVQATIEALTQENTALQEIINTEEKVRSLLGWFFKLFAK